MRTYNDLLNSLDLGDEVAERDPFLQSTFVATADYHEVLADRCDLITGVKGSGKSALAIMASEAALHSTIIVPAQDMVGPAVYEAATLPDPGEDYELVYRRLWTTHIISLAGSVIVRRFGGNVNVTQLQQNKLLSRLLTEKEGAPNEAWKLAVRAVQDGLVTDELLNRLLTDLRSTIQALGFRVWILFDRLDDVYGNRLELERRLTRGLLQAHIHVANFGPNLKTKLFLRSDLLERVTQEQGLRNLDKVRRLRLNINAWDLSRLILRRLVRSEDFSSLTAIDPNSAMTREEVISGMARLLPKSSPKIEENAPPQNAYGYILSRTADGTGIFAPRNVLAYMRLAVHEEKKTHERRASQAIPNHPILTTGALHQAWIRLSEDRLQNYLYAEFPELRPYVENLKGGSASYPSLGALGDVVRPGSNVQDLELIASGLEYSGLVTNSKETFSIARLYRPALRVSDPRSKRRR